MSEVDLLIKELSVRRLNRWGETEMICSKAAEALKKLSAEIDRQNNRYADMSAEADRLSKMVTAFRNQDAEIRAAFGGKRDGRPTIECLRDAFAAKWSAEDTLFQATLDMKTGELWAEVERLNSVLREWQIQAIDAETESARLAAENERLRTALEWYASSEAWTINQLEGAYGDYGRRARTALQDESDD